MTGFGDILPLAASLFAASAPLDAAAGAGTAVGTAAGIGSGIGAAAGGIGSAAIGVGDILTAGSALAGIGGTAAQLLQKKPGAPNIQAPQRDQAQLDADQRNLLLQRRGRASALLTPGGARGDQSVPSLGAAQLLGSG